LSACCSRRVPTLMSARPVLARRPRCSTGPISFRGLPSLAGDAPSLALRVVAGRRGIPCRARRRGDRARLWQTARDCRTRRRLDPWGRQPRSAAGADQGLRSGQQQVEPPFGGLLAPGAQVHRVFQSPGPIPGISSRRATASAKGARWVRHPHTAHQLGLADIQGRDPLDDLLFVLRLLQHGFLLTVMTSNRRWLPAGAAGTVTNLVRVLEATLKGP